MDLFAEFFSADRLVDLGASGLLVIVVLMILFGKLVPKSVSDAWKDAYYKAQAANEAKDRVIAQFADAGTVTARALDALPTPGGGDADVAETTETRRRRRQG